MQAHLPWLWAMAVVAATVVSLAWWYGTAILNPANVGWLLHGDPAQHLIGLSVFVSEPWQWPPGRTTGFGGTSAVVFTDSIPWLAMGVKLFGWPAHWQPFGLWMWACHLMLSWGCALWLWRMGVGAREASVAGVLYSFSPMVLLRAYGHEALMAHALLLLALLQWQKPWSMRAWIVLTAVSLGVHAYWALMVGVCAAVAGVSAWYCRHLSPSRVWGSLLLIRQAALGLVVLVLLAWLLGYSQGHAQVSAVGLGQYSANLLTWADPMDWPAFLGSFGRDPSEGANWSRAMPSLGHSHPGQYEGFAWLGTGGCLLVLFAGLNWAVHAFRTPAMRGTALGHWRWSPPVAAAVLLAVLALSPVWGVGSREWVRWPVPATLWDAWSVFRASGRLIWPLTWLLLLWAAWRVGRVRWGLGILLLAWMVQWVDMAPKRAELAQRFGGHMPGVASPLDNVLLSMAIRRCPDVRLLGPDVLTTQAWVPIGWLAAQSGASFSPAPTARPDPLVNDQAEHFSETLLTRPDGWPTRSLLVTWDTAGAPQWRVGWLAAWLKTVRERRDGQLLQVDGYHFWLPDACASNPQTGRP